ncbi:glycosyl hydrolase [Maricaulis parjimensis]|uniref:glycosyl hydrolase n=1 Tax=Maricaulis parjimensis TaxID=144023 RepID=UPI001939644A
MTEPIKSLLKASRLLTSVVLLGGMVSACAGVMPRPEAGTQAEAEASGPTEADFVDPPQSARPRVWWHWLNGNITRHGVEQDLAWMHRVGIGGVQNFDANLGTPQVVDERLVYMTPEWNDVFRHAVRLAADYDLEFAIAASPGWSETGGPWVSPEDGMKKLVWSETIVPGGEPVADRLGALPTETGVYQTAGFVGFFGAEPVSEPPVAHGEIAVLAVPLSHAPLPDPIHVETGHTTTSPAPLLDAALTTGVQVDPAGTSAQPDLILSFAEPVTVRSARLYVEHALPPFGPPRFNPELEAELEAGWTPITEIPLGEAATTVSFDAVMAQRFRIVLNPSNFTPSLSALGSVPGAQLDMGVPPMDGPAHISVGEFRLYANTLMPQSELRAGFGIAPSYHDLEDPRLVSGPVPDAVIDVTEYLQADGRLDWTPPAGQSWRIYRMGWSLTGKTNHPASPEATGLEVDKYDADAVRRYLETYLQRYADVVGEDAFGPGGISALLTDSVEIGPSNWTPRMLEEFEARRGYDARPWLPALAGAIIGTSEQTEQFLYDYRQTLAELLSDVHYRVVADVAHEHGLIVYGEALEDGRPVLGDELDMRRHADIPMSALWTFAENGQPRQGLLADMRGAASVAHFYGQNLVAAESMTSAFSPWAFAPADLQHVIDLELVSGVNRPVVHTSVHQPLDDLQPGLSLAIFGQYFNRHETWAEMAGPWVDYMSRGAYLLQQGRHVSDVAIFYGEDTPLTVLYNTPGFQEELPTRYGYDFINAAMLADLDVAPNGDLVSPGGARYRAIALSGTSAHMSLPVLEALHRLARAGAQIMGNPPVASPSLGDDDHAFSALVDRIWSLENVHPETGIEAGLEAIGVAPDFEVGSTGSALGLMFAHRTSGDAEIYFVVNPTEDEVTGDIRLRTLGRAPDIWDAVTGQVRPASYRQEGEVTVIPITIPANDSRFIVLRRPTDQSALQLVTPEEHALSVDLAPWTVSFQPGRGAPQQIEMNALRALETFDQDGIRYFSGVASYDTHFDMPVAGVQADQVWLDLGRVGDVAEVIVNGESAGIVWRAPYRLDIAPILEPGTNTLEIRVANLWVNRLIGDRQEGADAISFTAAPTYMPDAPLRPSGLIGPVSWSVTR